METYTVTHTHTLPNCVSTSETSTDNVVLGWGWGKKVGGGERNSLPNKMRMRKLMYGTSESTITFAATK